MITGKHLFYIQLRKARQGLGFKLSLLILVILTCFSFWKNVLPLYATDQATLMSAARMWSFYGVSPYLLMFGLPLLSALIFSNEIRLVSNEHILQFLITRTDRIKYYWATAGASAFWAFTLLFFSLSLSQLLWIIACPFQSTQPLTQFVHTDFEGVNVLILKELFFTAPYLYNLVYMFLISSFGAAIAFFASSLSFILKSSLQIFLVPLILFMAQNFISAGTGQLRFSISETLTPVANTSNLSLKTYGSILLFFLIMGLVLMLYGIFQNRDEFA